MSAFDVKRFSSDLQKDPTLMEEFTLLGENPEAWVELAASKGYELSIEEATGLSTSHRELSDDELENVAGGWDTGSGGGGG